MKRPRCPHVFAAFSLVAAACAPTSGLCADPVAADTRWHHIEEIQHKLQGDAPKGVNEVEYSTPIEAELHAAAADFVAQDPADPRRWDARVLEIRTVNFPAPAADRRAIFAQQEADLADILAAADAPAKTKQDAERAVLRQHLDHLDLIDTPEDATVLEARITDYLRRFPEDPKASAMEVRRIDLWQKVDPAKASALLDEMARSTDAQVAAAAQGRKAQKALTAEPLDWVLASVDGEPIDFKKLRGKVVLVDFWASWCPDCMRELPAVVAAYHQYHDQGFEIVGISLDKDKEAMLATMLKRGIVWPQSFDGKGWKSDIAVRYGVKGIPELWLVGQDGRIVATGLQIDQLAPRIASLLGSARSTALR